MPFDPHATTFSLQNARVLGQAAAIAYQAKPVCGAWADANGFPSSTLDFFDNRDTQGFVVQNDAAIIVAFRGTQPTHPMDWFVDAGAIPHAWDHGVGTVHKGFYEALRAIWGVKLPDGRHVLPERLLNRGNRTVWITGHSLGGALAELCAAQAFFVNGIPVQGVYTFGQPRVGNQAFATLVDGTLGSHIFRFVNDRDIVPRVPLFSTGYRHYGCQTLYDHAGKGPDSPLASSVETVASALRFAALALNVDPLLQAADLLKDKAADLLGHGHKAGDITSDQEKAALEQWRKILRGGVENIDDHNMTECYLKRLDASLSTV